MSDAAVVLARYAQELLGSSLPLRIRAWDGSEAGPADGPVLVLRSRRVLRRLLWQPNELGLTRAWVTGELTVEGDLYEALSWLAGVLRESEPRQGERLPLLGRSATALLRLATSGRPSELLSLAGGLPLPLPRPREEVSRRRGREHAPGCRCASISHHHDIGDDFYRLVLGPSLVFSCAYWDEASISSSGRPSLEQAQHDKIDLVCRKLGLLPGMRLLDVGCGWGSLALHAARVYGVHVTAVTNSVEQAALARKRIAATGLANRIAVQVRDYRDVADGPYDAISSIGVAEHVGKETYRTYVQHLRGLLRPGGRLLNHQIAHRPLHAGGRHRMNAFIDRYVVPGRELTPIGSTISVLEESGFEVRDLEALREHYALTLRAWVANLEERWDEAVRLVGPGRARVWRLYMAATALDFESNVLGVNQVLAVRTTPEGDSGLPLAARRQTVACGL
ncbi:class I SAM-dependent methyltransferase [Streptomyces sp. NRRL S-813]|uniref:class I SAM-dependent methyltransferase n=1 Tax=Streptomyces sp. NRRL S-813 TaxID=1463919 RepID=UPI0004C0613B|nr:class I SAM-dependent methyltransferase [Streptomyces sp. NRRL S-813]